MVSDKGPWNDPDIIKVCLNSLSSKCSIVVVVFCFIPSSEFLKTYISSFVCKMVRNNEHKWTNKIVLSPVNESPRADNDDIANSKVSLAHEEVSWIKDDAEFALDIN